MLANLSSLGVGVVNYFNSGSLLLSLIYFFVTTNCCMKKTKRSSLGYLDEPQTPRSLLYTKMGTFDWQMVGLIILAAFFQGAVIYAITYTFQFSIAAGLNIGIA